jgi:hypothetical protein
MKKIMMIVAFAGFSAAMNAQDAPATAPDPNAADIKWESTAIDYGNVKKGDESSATREFKFTNIGKSPLILSSCRGSCGCMAVAQAHTCGVRNHLASCGRRGVNVRFRHSPGRRPHAWVT